MSVPHISKEGVTEVGVLVLIVFGLASLELVLTGMRLGLGAVVTTESGLTYGATGCNWVGD